LGLRAREVYFDDFKVEHVKSPVIQSEDYYAFGMSFNSYQRENSLSNQYQYNGKEVQDELSLGWLDYGRRMYQSDLGRFFSQDRFAEKYYTISPYQYGANNPILLVDINGDSLNLSHLNEEQRTAYDAQISKLSQNKLFKAYYDALSSSKTMYTFKAGAGKGGSGSFNPKTNEVHANLESAYAVSQELFHAFQSDLGVYNSEDQSVRETEGDLVSGSISLSIGEPTMSEDWDQGIKFNYTDDNMVFGDKVLTKDFDKDFNKAVDARIDFYKKRETQEGAAAPSTYVQKNSGAGAKALKELVRRFK
jgi:RHS repeat-associated protein